MTDIYAHRGGAGIYPESTLVAYQHALALGADVLDVDLAVTKDNVIVASHDPFLNSSFTRDSQGNWLTTDDLLIKNFTFDELQQFDVGRLNLNHDYAKRYPEQQGLDGQHIPSLQQIIDLGVKRLQLEIKTNPIRPELTLEPPQFMALLNQLLISNNMDQQTEVHSFDWRNMLALQAMKSSLIRSYISSETDPLLTTETVLTWHAGYDVVEFGGSYPNLIAHLGGQVWSPEFTDLSAEKVLKAHELGLKVVTWTVDVVADMRLMLDFNVDGIITNRPDRLADLMAKKS